MHARLHPEISDRNAMEVTPPKLMLRPSLIHICTTSYQYTGHTVPLFMQSHPRIHGLGCSISWGDSQRIIPARKAVSMCTQALHRCTPKWCDCSWYWLIPMVDNSWYCLMLVANIFLSTITSHMRKIWCHTFPQLASPCTLSKEWSQNPRILGMFSTSLFFSGKIWH